MEVITVSKREKKLDLNRGNKLEWTVKFKKVEEPAKIKKKGKPRGRYAIKKQEPSLVKDLEKRSIVSNAQFIKSEQPIVKLFMWFPRKTGLENFLNLLQYPAPDSINAGINLFAQLTEGFRNAVNMAKKMAKMKAKLQSSPAIDIGISPIMDIKERNDFGISNEWVSYGIDSFLSKSCKVMRLFLYKKLYFSTRGHGLKLVILVCGLRLMELPSHIEKKVTMLEKEIFNLYSKPNRVKFSLENLQAYLIIVNQLSHLSWATAMRVQLVIHCQNMAMALGLFRHNSKLPVRVQYERRLAYNIVVFLSLANSLLCGTLIPSPFKLGNTPKMYKLINENDLDFGNRIFNELLGELSGIIYLIRFHKENYLQVKKSHSDLKTLSTKYWSVLQTIHSKYCPILSKLIHSSQNDVKYENHFKSLSSMLDFLIYFYKFVILSLEFYHPAFKSKDSNSKQARDLLVYSRETPSKSHIEATLETAQQIVMYALPLKPPYIPMFLIPLMSQAMTFLLRYHRQGQSNRNMCIRLGLDKVKELENQSGAMFLFKFDSKLLEMVANITKH